MPRSSSAFYGHGQGDSGHAGFLLFVAGYGAIILTRALKTRNTFRTALAGRSATFQVLGLVQHAGPGRTRHFTHRAGARGSDLTTPGKQT